MAVHSSPASKKMVSAKKNERSETNKRKQDDDNGNQPKRSRCPRVRVVGSRIYDSQNGKTCHQVIFILGFLISNLRTFGL